MKIFNNYIEKILDRIDCSREEREDMREEIRSHLEAARDAYQEQGYTEEEAIRKAVADFGVEEEIGEGLQQTLFPYRNQLLTGMGAGILLYGTSGYLHALFSYGQAHVIWVTLSAVVGTGLILAAMYPAYAANRKVWMGSAFAVMIVCVFFGFAVLEQAETWYAKPLYVLGSFLGIGALVMIFLTALKGWESGLESKRERKKRIAIHLFNLMSGIPVCGLALLMAYGGLLFGGLSPFVLIPLGMIAFWAFSYWAQYRMRIRYAALSYLFGSLSLLLTCGVIYMIVTKML